MGLAVMLRDLARKASYLSGALGLYHRVRNARTLTVVMFHRVLDPCDPRWSVCDPDYTLPVDVFRSSLGFFSRHYNVVSIGSVLRARAGPERLPPRALLLTFDDGWADNVDYALPELKAAGLPGVMFVVSDAVGRAQPFFQEQLVSAWRRGVLRVDELDAALAMQRPAGREGCAGLDGLQALRALITELEDLDGPARDAVLGGFATQMEDGLRHMVDIEELARLRSQDVELGLHGKTHTPMTRAADLDAELCGARRQLAAMTGSAPTASMSFPYGAHDAATAQRARQAGYELVFTSIPVLNAAGPRPGWLLGRTGYETAAVVDRKGRFRPDWLALNLFRRPVSTLGGPASAGQAHSSSSALVRWMSRSRGSWLGGWLQ